MVFVFGLLIGGGGGAQASGIGTSSMTVDFTAAKAVELARWTQPGHVRLDERGLGWDGRANSSRDVVIETTKPLAIAHDWWGATNAGVRVIVDWDGPEAGGIWGHAFVRHSPNARDWSAWIEVPRTDRAKKTPRHEHRLRLSTPGSVGSTWYAIYRRYLATEPAHRDRTQSKAADWIASKRPGYLAKVKPFFGYMQFRYECNAVAGHRVRDITAQVTYVTPGPAGPPRIPGEDTDRWRRAWDHRAPGARDPAQAEADEATTRDVLRAALDHARSRAARPEGVDEAFETLVLVDQTAIGPDLLDLHTGAGLPSASPFSALPADAWADARMRNRRIQIVPSLSAAGQEVRTTTNEGARYLLEGRAGRASSRYRDPETRWRFWRARSKALGIAWVSEPGLSTDRKQAIVHVGVATGPATITGRWHRLAMVDGAWTVAETTE